MRLLNIHTKQLKTFIGSDRPPYAILSHTWGEDEVEFAHVNTPGWTDKRGYKKIDLMCRQAAKEPSKLEWCWIDTICINKESSSELSEAINSMFAWYTDAAVCYAYLEDVDASALETSLPQAKWFSRGWTLQELLAPRRVDFYGKGWTKLGMKDTESVEISDFVSTLAVITQIDELVLWKPGYMRGKSVAARMSWASHRQTTRKEDLAYCLMGLFDVNMPLLYGEGERAFVRLQEEIIKISDDHSIFAWDRDLEGGRAVSCFAPSPSLFRRGTLVVPFGRKQTAITPYSLTNQGLQITLPIYQKPGSDIVHGLLNCHWANTLTECIGIPLRPTSNSEVFERSPSHGPESIALQAMTETKPKNIFLSTRPRLELPFAAEVSLQIYDESLVDKLGFSHVDVDEPPNASYHWHPDYGNYRLRWLASGSDSVNGRVCLIWRHDSLEDDGISLELSCTIGSRSENIGSFRMRGLRFLTGVSANGSVHATDDDEPVLKAETSIAHLTAKGSNRMYVAAHLQRRNVFGNEVYTLTLSSSDNSMYEI